MRAYGRTMETRGFTLIEVTVAIVIGVILTSIAVNVFGGAQSRYAVRGGQNTFAAVHARARAYAIERGVTARLNVDTAGDSVWVESGGTRVETLYFGRELNLDIRSDETSPITLCMTPRGYADSGCNSFGAPIEIAFAQGPDSRSVQLWPLGQLAY